MAVPRSMSEDVAGPPRGGLGGAVDMKKSKGWVRGGTESLPEGGRRRDLVTPDARRLTPGSPSAQPLVPMAPVVVRRAGRKGCRFRGAADKGFSAFQAGGGGWIRTTELVRGQIYSLLRLTTSLPHPEPRSAIGEPRDGETYSDHSGFRPDVHREVRGGRVAGPISPDVSRDVALMPWRHRVARLSWWRGVDRLLTWN